MRLAVIGSGISGISAAWLLSAEHEVDILEAEGDLGGHTHTVDIRVDDTDATADTGFMVFNHRTYPNLVKLFEHFGIPEQAADMSFSVQHFKDGVEWKGDLGGLFAQPGNVVRPAFWGMLGDVLRMSRNAERLLADPTCDDLTLGELLQREKYGHEFLEWYLVPMGAAIWSMPTGKMLAFPAKTFLRFCDNHGLLHITGKPQWKSVPGGARRYTRALAEKISGHIRTGARVTSVRRFSDRVDIRLEDGEQLSYDGVVLAAHADQTLAMLSDASPAEVAMLESFPYSSNDVILHTDKRFLPASKRAWAAWNYASDGHGNAPVSVTYLLNILQGVPVETPVMVTLNPLRDCDTATIIERRDFAHPQFGRDAIGAQASIPALQGANRTWFAGAWQRYGFHEDGLISGLRVADSLGVKPPWGAILDPEER